MLWRVMADIVVAVHATYIAIVVVGLAAILIGSAAQWRWVRNFCFRAAHLAMILLVCAEALVGTTCPLTRLENTLRLRGGETAYASDFIGYWLDWLIFYDARPGCSRQSTSRSACSCSRPSGSPRCDGPCAEELIVEEVGGKPQLGALARSPFERP